ncbi:MAG: hypothetical protein ACRDZQ_16495 [Acidimicrobiales bacterium]
MAGAPRKRPPARPKEVKLHERTRGYRRPTWPNPRRPKGPGALALDPAEGRALLDLLVEGAEDDRLPLVLVPVLLRLRHHLGALGW